MKGLNAIDRLSRVILDVRFDIGEYVTGYDEGLIGKVVDIRIDDGEIWYKVHFNVPLGGRIQGWDSTFMQDSLKSMRHEVKG